MSVQSGQSKSSGSSQQSSPYAPILAKFGVQALKGAEPVQQQLLGQESEALQTGGITNRIPIENRQIDAARQAGSMTAQSTQDILSKYGLANSAFGARTLAEENAQTNQNVANVPANDAEAFISGAPGVISTAQGTGAGLLSNAGALDVNRSATGTNSSFGSLSNITDPNSNLLTMLEQGYASL